MMLISSWFRVVNKDLTRYSLSILPVCSCVVAINLYHRILDLSFGLAPVNSASTVSDDIILKY